MPVPVLICLVFAFVLFLLAAFAWPVAVDPYRGKLVAAGLAFYMLSLFVTMILKG
jgi:hypothetical protein